MTQAPIFVLAHDVGTTGSKTCLYRIADTIEPVDAAIEEYPLIMTDDGGAEQKADDWWAAICKSTRAVLERSKIAAERIAAMGFCCQMQGSILVDAAGRALRNPMIYMDGRATRQIEKNLYHGLFRISGWNARKTLTSLWITGGLAATPKDPLWKYHWVRDNEPEIFAKVHKWLDVKDYLILRSTGQFGMTQDSAHITFVYDTRPGRLGWHKGLCKMFDVNMDHLPPVVDSTDVVGHLTEDAASQVGLVPGIPVFGGGGDVAMTAIGAGCVDLHDTHIYVGTSGWVASNVDKRMVDIGNFMASILCAMPGRYNYIAEQETSGACLKWVRDHLALDGIGVYLKDRPAADAQEELGQLYDLLNQVVDQTAPGAGNLIFTPWLHGNRSPREDAYVRGMFFNMGIDTGKRMMIRAVLEGVAFHKRWMLEAAERKIPYQPSVRFVGGGAKSPIWCQIMADVTGRQIETVAQPQDVGAMGAALVCAVGLGRVRGFQQAKEMVPVVRTFSPRPEYRAVYDRNFKVFKALYEKNKKLFKTLNHGSHG
ncbi:MAG: FGGY-family carbohydrate kinase [Desulfobacterales bacterium]|nr:FGGY-family carbohydrate kinase [Desulfobacterales bacterium]